MLTNNKHCKFVKYFQCISSRFTYYNILYLFIFGICVGPTSFAPVINAAISLVEKSWQYHVLVIIADGQVIK